MAFLTGLNGCQLGGKLTRDPASKTFANHCHMSWKKKSLELTKLDDNIVSEKSLLSVTDNDRFYSLNIN